MKDLDKIFQAFTDFSTLQIVGQVMNKMKEFEINLEEYQEWIKNKGHRIVPANSLTKMKNIPWADIPRVKIIRKCPKCGKLLKLGEVNVSSDTRVEGDFQSQWYCGGTCQGCKKELKIEGCGWEEFSTKSFLEEAFPYMVKI